MGWGKGRENLSTLRTKKPCWEIPGGASFCFVVSYLTQGRTRDKM